MKHVVSLALAACALAGAANAETRNASGFTEINAADRVTVEVTVGETYLVQVTGPDAERVRTHVDGRTLRISDRDRPWFGRAPDLDATVRVTAPRVAGVAAARGAELTATLSGQCGGFSAAAAMGGVANVSGINCSDVSASASMGGSLQMAGACNELSATASMGGDIRAGELQCRTVDASASMGGALRVYASESYDASAAMGGEIDVAGAARRGDTSAALGGSISH
ncbi:MAG: GIN domain-containing protein [Vitreimonas sp.]